MLRLQGQKVLLRSTQESDLPQLIEIRLTPEVKRRWCGGDDLHAELVNDMAGDTQQLTILRSSEKIVGLIQFEEEADQNYRHAWIDMYIDPQVHRQGFGSDALKTLMTHLVEAVGHHRLSIDPATDNEAAIACYRSVGFRPVGIMRQYERQLDGTWGDSLLMDYLAEDG